MRISALVPFYEKLEGLIHRLPEGLQHPILREISPIKTLLLLQRPPRIALLGSAAAAKGALLAVIFGEEATLPGQPPNEPRWQAIGRAGRGSLRLLDARRPASIPILRDEVQREVPDIVIFISQTGDEPGVLASDLDHAAEIFSLLEAQPGGAPNLLGLLLPADVDSADGARQELHAALHGRPELSARTAGTLTLAPSGRDPSLPEWIDRHLPGEAQLEWARLSGNRPLQNRIAQIVIKSVSAICAAIGAQPIPLADFPILTSLQATMVATIMHISGREMSRKLAAEFMAAVGANIGLGLALREGARAAVKLIPGWGNAISGAVAGGGTYSVGQAAAAYFIDGLSLPDARRLFRRGKNETPRLPQPPISS